DSHAEMQPSQEQAKSLMVDGLGVLVPPSRARFNPVPDHHVGTLCDEIIELLPDMVRQADEPVAHFGRAELRSFEVNGISTFMEHAERPSHQLFSLFIAKLAEVQLLVDKAPELLLMLNGHRPDLCGQMMLFD